MVTQPPDPIEYRTREEAFEAGVEAGKELAFQLLVDPPRELEEIRNQLIDLVMAIRERGRRGG